MRNLFSQLTFLLSLSSVSYASDAEDRLLQHLFDEQHYNPLVRPTQYLNQTVVVSFGLLLVQLIHVRKYTIIDERLPSFHVGFLGV